MARIATKIRRTISVHSVFLLLVLLSGAMANAQEVTPALTPLEMKEDLAFLRDTWAPTDRSFSAEERVAFRSVVNSAIHNAETLTAADFALEVARAVAISGNGHTVAEPHRFLTFLPVRLWWFSDGLYVVRAHPDFSDLIGAKVLRVGAFSVEDALDELTPFLAGTAEWRRYIGTPYLSSIEALYRVGISVLGTSFEQYARGIDGVLDAVIEMINKAPIGTLMAP